MFRIKILRKLFIAHACVRDVLAQKLTWPV